MFSILSNKLTYSDLKTSVENARQTRPFEVVRTGSGSNRDIKQGYKGNTILKDSYYFTNILFDDTIPLAPGDRILLFGQTNQIENGIWNVMSIIQENIQYVNIQRPTDYAKNTPIRSGQYLLIVEGATLSGKLYKNTTPEYDSNENKIIAYNGTSPQTWQYYTNLEVQVLKPIPKVTFYAGYNFTGNSQEFAVGYYYLMARPGSIPYNDRDNDILNYFLEGSLSSIKIPFGYQVTLYSSRWFSELTPFITLTSNVSDLRSVGFDNYTSSFIISSI